MHRGVLQTRNYLSICVLGGTQMEPCKAVPEQSTANLHNLSISIFILHNMINMINIYIL